MNVVTKSGTNDFHGSAYEFFQNESLNARGYFDNRATPENPSERNQYGAVLGGPVVNPGRLRRAQSHVLHGRVGGHPAGRSRPVRSCRCPPRRCGGAISPKSPPQSGTRLPASPSRATSSRLRCSRPSHCSCCQYFRWRTCPAPRPTTRAPRRTRTSTTRCCSVPIRISGPEVRLFVPLQLAGFVRESSSPSALEIQPVWQPRVNKNWLGWSHSTRWGRTSTTTSGSATTGWTWTR